MRKILKAAKENDSSCTREFQQDQQLIYQKQGGPEGSQDIFKVLKGKKSCQARILHVGKLPSENEERKKDIPR